MLHGGEANSFAAPEALDDAIAQKQTHDGRINKRLHGPRFGVHCMKCARFAVMNPAELPFAPETPVLSLHGRFRCIRCASRDTGAAGISVRQPCLPPLALSNVLLGLGGFG